MSALGGIYSFEEKPIAQEQLTLLGDALASYGPDGSGEIRNDAMGMVYRAFWTNSEARNEVQPFTSQNGLILCWDGRLDNRDELASLLNEVCASETDVGIVLAAYQRWGLDCLSRIIGDFALSLWDSGSRTLFLARDPIGPRPLFYHLSTKSVIWSSELSPLLDLSGSELQINDDYVAGYLSSGPPPGLTPYKNFHTVPPGSVVIFGYTGMRTCRLFWQLPRQQIRYATDAEYEEHFLHLFRKAVRSRLRVEGTVWATLSGGLDSSSIVCMADEILKSNSMSSPRLETVSYVYDEAIGADERSFIRCAEENRGRVGHYLRDVDYRPLASFPADNEISFPDFLDCFVERHQALCDAMRENGARVLLTGHGGDQVLSGAELPVPGLADQILRGKFLQVHHDLRIWSKQLQKPYLTLLSDTASLFLPRRIRCRFARWQDSPLPPWLDKVFAARINRAERSLGLIDQLNFQLPSQRDQASWFFSIVRALSWASYRSRGRIEVSYPFLDRALIEFLQAIPFDQRVRPGESRSLQRRALRNLLPQKILNRKGKRGPDESFFRAIDREWSRLEPMFANACVCARGYMDGPALRLALQRGRHGCQKHSFDLIKTISLEFWLRALERRNSRARNAAAVVGSASADSGCNHRQLYETESSRLAGTAFLTPPASLQQRRDNSLRKEHES